MSGRRCSSSMSGGMLDQRELRAELARDDEDGESRQLHLINGEQPEQGTCGKKTMAVRKF
jgi:hypothetical protein